MATIQTHPTVSISDLPACLVPLLKIGDVPFMLSTPGLGKTETAMALARELGAAFVPFVASMMDRLDLGGLPHVTETSFNGGPKVSVAAFAPNSLMASLSVELNPNGGPVLLYLNEFNAAPESTLPVFMRLLNERAIGALTLRKNVFIIADGNPASSNSCGHDLPEALKRRLRPFLVTTSVPAWTTWAVGNEIDGRIITFLSTSGFEKHFNDFDANRPDRLTYSTPAGWSRLSPALAGAESLTGDSHLALVSAYVGVESAVAFEGFLAHKDSLPNIAEMLKSPMDCPLPTKPDVLAYMVGAVVEVCRAPKGPITGAIQLTERLLGDKSAGRPEFGALLARMLLGDKKLVTKMRADAAKDALASLLRSVSQNPSLMRALAEVTEK